MAGKRATRIDAMLRHLAAGEDVQAFPGTKYENLALLRSVERRGLILWDKEGNRYTLTPAGWNALTPRRFGLPSLLVSTGVGAAVGAAALAMLWLPGLQWPTRAQGQAAPLAAITEKPIATPASLSVDRGGRSIAPMQASTAQPAHAPLGAGPATSPAAVSPPEPAPLAEQPTAEPAPAAVKQATVKKPHRRTVRRYEPSNYGWGFGNGWRTRQSADSRYGQGSYYNYR